MSTARKVPTKTASKTAAKPALPAGKAPAAPKAAAKPVKPAATFKPVVGLAAKPAAKPAREAAVKLPVPDKAPKVKLVRDSFAMPAFDHGQIAVLKKRALAFQRPAKKSELLRAGLHALVALDDKAFKAALNALAAVKTGRPKKH
jgi:hypothetical protein